MMTNHINVDQEKNIFIVIIRVNKICLCMMDDQSSMYGILSITPPKSNNLMHDDTSENII